MRKEDICIRIQSEVEAKMLYRLLTEAGEPIFGETKDRIKLGGHELVNNTHIEFYGGQWMGSGGGGNKKAITIYQLREILGLAPQMGRRPKYAEPTKCVSFKVPISKIEAIKAIVREELSKVEIKKEEAS